MHLRGDTLIVRGSTTGTGINMSKTSKLAIVAAIAASIATPALAQVVDPRYAPPLYDYDPAPGFIAASPFSNFPAATGGGSYGYNEGLLRDAD